MRDRSDPQVRKRDKGKKFEVKITSSALREMLKMQY